MEPSTVRGNGRKVDAQIARIDGVDLEGGAASLSPLVGRLIKGKYRVTSSLGIWPLGTLYTAEQVGAEKPVVLKVVQGKFARYEEFAYRLRQQMTVVAALSETQPNIARVYDCDQTEDGSLFVAMEFLEGRTLWDVMQQEGAFEIKKALSYAVQIAEGLSAAHDAGIVHTDIRPQNCMILGDGEAVKIIGFEAARLRNVGAMDHLAPMQEIPRAAEYLAPEQIRRGEITRQTDIYAFGVVLYEMLTGVVPFRASTPEAAMAMHLQKKPSPLRVLRPEIPMALEAKVLQALEKDPKRRESFATDVVNDSLLELVGEELGAEPSQGKQGEIHGKRMEAQEDMDAIRGIVSKSERAGGRWRSAVIGGLLILIAAVIGWMVFRGDSPEVSYRPQPQYRPEEARGSGPSNAGKTLGETSKPSAPPSAARPSAGVSTRQNKPKERKTLADKESTLTPKQGEEGSSRSTQTTTPPPPDQSSAADTRTGSPDPSEVIDWLFKQR